MVNHHYCATRSCSGSASSVGYCDVGCFHDHAQISSTLRFVSRDCWVPGRNTGTMFVLTVTEWVTVRTTFSLECGA